MINKLSESLKIMIGKMEVLEDEGLRTSETIVDGSCIGASDGSLMKGFQCQRGSHRYTLREIERDRGDIVRNRWDATKS